MALTREQKTGMALIGAPATYAVLLLAIPLAAILLISFWSQTGVRDFDTSFTLKNYAEAVSEPIYRALMLRSLKISGMVTLITVLLAFPVAYFISFGVRPERKSLWIFLITIPFWTSYLIRVFLWKVILGFNGVLNSGLKFAGIIDQPLTALLYNANSVVITLAHSYAPFAILPIFVALEKIDRSLLEASRDLGENRAMTFWRVTLPLALPGVIAALLIVFIPTVGDYVTPDLIGGPSGTMISNMIQAQFLRLNNAPLGAALAILAMVIVGAISIVVALLLGRKAGARK